MSVWVFWGQTRARASVERGLLCGSLLAGSFAATVPSSAVRSFIQKSGFEKTCRLGPFKKLPVLQHFSGFWACCELKICVCGGRTHWCFQVAFLALDFLPTLGLGQLFFCDACIGRAACSRRTASGSSNLTPEAKQTKNRRRKPISENSDERNY